MRYVALQMAASSLVYSDLFCIYKINYYLNEFASVIRLEEACARGTAKTVLKCKSVANHFSSPWPRLGVWLYGEISSRLAFCGGLFEDPARARETGLQSCSRPRARARGSWAHVELGQRAMGRRGPL